MVARPNHPIENVRELQRRLYIAAKRQRLRRFHESLSVGVTFRRIHGHDTLTPEARMSHEKTIGKPDAGNSHVRFERGPQETEPVRHRA